MFSDRYGLAPTDEPREIAARAEHLARGGDLRVVASILARERNEILDNWLTITAQLPFHSGRQRRGVADHIPELFDAVVRLLERAMPSWKDAKPPLDDPDVLEAVRRHAGARFQQGLQPPDLVTEFRVLRQEIERALRIHLPDDVPASDVIAAELLVHDALDGAINLALTALGKDLEELREDILATTVHDVQQPITTLKGRLQLAMRILSGQAPDHGRVATIIDQAVTEVDRMAALLATLGTASRVALGRVETHGNPTDMRQLVQAALERLGPESIDRVHVEVPSDVETSGMWDAQLLQRVLGNLLSNAMKYSAPEMPIDIAVRNEGDAVHLTVRDHGIGFAPDEVGELFQRYRRTQRAREAGTEGAGLGLYVSRGIVEAHGGRIWAESPGVDLGAIFHVVLPRNWTDSAPPQACSTS